MGDLFHRIASKVSNATGTPGAFLLAVSVIVVWGLVGPIFGFSDTWQLVINTGTTIVTFLMVFLIQNTQNRDGKAMQLKLDELIRVTRARDTFVDLEDLTDHELEAIELEFSRWHDGKALEAPMHKLHQRIIKMRDSRSKNSK